MKELRTHRWLLSVAILAFLTPHAHAQGAHYKNVSDYLTSRIYYKTGKALHEPCPYTLLGPNSVGGLVFAPGTEIQKILPLSDVTAIEVVGDQITLPAPMIVQALTEGRLTQGLMALVTDTVSVEVRFKNKECYNFTFFPEAMPNRVKSGDALISTPKIPDSEVLSKIKPGMSRADFEKSMTRDGGIYVQFKQERYVRFLKNYPVKDRVIKLNVAFKPAGMSDDVYFLGKWVPPEHTSPDDILMRMSPVYLDHPLYG